MSYSYRLLAALFCLYLFSTAVVCQDDKPKISEEVTVYAEDAIYKELRGLSGVPGSFTGDYVTVTNLVLVKDQTTFTLKSGEVYFLTSSTGRAIGAVFLGDGEFYMLPPVDSERKHLAIFTEAEEVKEKFDRLTMFFSDRTMAAIKSSPNAKVGTGGPQVEKARAAFKEKEVLLKSRFRYNINSRTLSDLYAPRRPGFFVAFIDGAKFGKLVYSQDPLGLPEAYPEQVSLTSYGDTTGGIWAAYHLAEEYKKGTANSWQNRSIYDIKHHNLDVTVDDTKLIVTDEVTIQMREADARFLPFDLYGSLRVSSVKDEAGSALVMIQEKKGTDTDLGVILPKPVEPGKPFKLVFQYEGGDALIDAGESNFFLGPRSTWYPNNPLTSFGDRAAFDIKFRYAKKYMMVGVGSRLGAETIEGDQKVSTWSSEGVELAVAGFNYGDFKMQELADKETGLKIEVFTNKSVPGEIKNLQSMIQQEEFRTGNNMSAQTLGSANTAQGAQTILVEAQNAIQWFFWKDAIQADRDEPAACRQFRPGVAHLDLHALHGFFW